jgi:hypothetical protein
VATRLIKGINKTGRVSIRKARQSIQNYFLLEKSERNKGSRKAKTITSRDTASGRDEIHFYVPKGLVWATNEGLAKPRKS